MDLVDGSCGWILWRTQTHPLRLRATNHRCGGVMRMLAALDLCSSKVHYRVRPRKRAGEFMGFLEVLRPRWPGEKCMWSWNNFSPHRHQSVRRWVADNDAESVFLPTHGSWLNWIESGFVTLQYFALSGIDHRSHAEQSAAIAAYVRAQCENPFAPDLPIRLWTEFPHDPAKVAREASRFARAYNLDQSNEPVCVETILSPNQSGHFENRILQPILMADETAR
jgi:hypothetical protein